MDRDLKNHLFGQYERIGKVLSSSRRLEILDLLSGGEHTVEQVARATGLSVANASQHLRHALAARLVAVRRDGSYSYYSLASPDVRSLVDLIRKIAYDRLPGVKPILDAHVADWGREMSAEELIDCLGDEGTVIVDVRPASDYRAKRIRRARSIPAEEMEDRFNELPRRSDIVLYDSGDDTVRLRMSVRVLTDHGFVVRRLEGGIAGWIANGLPTTKSVSLSLNGGTGATRSTSRARL